jgi:hypothetical protein
VELTAWFSSSPAVARPVAEMPTVKTAPDPLLTQIQAFVAGNGGGVVVRKVGGGYSLFRESSARPVARFRPTGQGDAVEVKWWSHRDRWDDIGDFGPLVLPLGQALTYLVEDPMGCFWH